MQRREQEGFHQPTPAWIISAAQPALESEHLKPKKCKAPTHRDSAHNKRCITNKHGHLQTIYTQTHMDERLQRTRTWTDRNMISHIATGVYRGSFSTEPPPLPAGKKGSCSASLSRPKTRAVLAQVCASPTVNPTGENTTCHAQTEDYPGPQALRRGTLYPKTYLDPQTYLSANYL